MVEKIFDSTNVVGTVMKYSKGTTTLSPQTLRENIGTCAALSTIWLANMYTKRVELSMPDQALAAIMFSKNWIRKTGRNRTLANIKDAGLTSTNFWTYDSLTNLFGDLRVYDGYHLIELTHPGGHYIASIKNGTDFYLYDSNVALWKYADAAEFESDGKAKLTGQGWSDVQTLYVDQVRLSP